ncbi:hypothetical protein GGQ94_003051 [Petrimonas sulfuriphila]
MHEEQRIVSNDLLRCKITYKFLIIVLNYNQITLFRQN